MKCPLEIREGTEILLAYSSGDLDGERSARLAPHVENCPACREFVTGQRAVWEALDEWEALPVSVDFDRRLYRRIAEQVSWWETVARPLRSALVRRGLPIAAAAALTITAGLLLDRPSAVPVAARHESAQVELQPDQVERALDQMETLRQFTHLLHTDSPDSQM
jgi:anti-sigma factor RsiW